MMRTMEDRDIEEKIVQHRRFLERESADRPLIGCISGWEDLSRYVTDTETFFRKGRVDFRDLTWDHFLPMYSSYAASLLKSMPRDDLFRTIEPLPFFPWTEAAAGCSVTYTGKNFWSSPAGNTSRHSDRIKIEADNRDSWAGKYGEFLSCLGSTFGGEHPVGQSILRGPVDVAAALFGDERLLYLFFDDAPLVRECLSAACDVFLAFIEVQKSRTPSYYGGSVIGQYYIWTPGTSLRFQEDAMALLSPSLYEEFVLPLDRKIAGAAEYSLFHLHSSGLHLLDFLLSIGEIDVFQVSKDEGVELEKVLPALLKIQKSERCVMLKGKLSDNDLLVIKERLDFSGLCIQAVVEGPEEADAVLGMFR